MRKAKKDQERREKEEKEEKERVEFQKKQKEQEIRAAMTAKIQAEMEAAEKAKSSKKAGDNEKGHKDVEKSKQRAEGNDTSSGSNQKTEAGEDGGRDLEDLLDREVDLEESRQRKRTQKLERLWAMQRRNNTEGVGQIFKDQAKKDKKAKVTTTSTQDLVPGLTPALPQMDLDK